MYHRSKTYVVKGYSNILVWMWSTNLAILHYKLYDVWYDLRVLSTTTTKWPHELTLNVKELSLRIIIIIINVFIYKTNNVINK